MVEAYNLFEELNSLTKIYFNKSSIKEIEIEEINAQISLYPYNSFFRLLYLLKIAILSLTHENISLEDEIYKNQVYFKNPIWLNFFIHTFKEEILEESKVKTEKNKKTKIIKVSSESQVSNNPKKEIDKKEDVGSKNVKKKTNKPAGITLIKPKNSTKNQIILHPPKHHVNSTITATDEDENFISNDRKDMSDWLLMFAKSGHKNNFRGLNRNNFDEDATKSNDENLYTETMARLYEKQNNVPKAIFTYKKLISLFPDKAKTFEKKIISLKNKK